MVLHNTEPVENNMITLQNKPRAEVDRIIRLPEVLAMTGVSESTITRWERGGEFPCRLRIGARSVGWRLSQVSRWIVSRNAAISEEAGGSDDG